MFAYMKLCFLFNLTLTISANGLHFTFSFGTLVVYHN